MSDETRNIIEAIEDSQLRNIIEVAMTLDKIDRSVLLMQAQALLLLSEPTLRENGTVQESKNELQYRRQRLIRKLKER